MKKTDLLDLQDWLVDRIKVREALKDELTCKRLRKLLVLVEDKLREE